MIEFEPMFITFDCYGTLTAFGMSAVTRELLGDRVPAERLEDFLDDFEAHRLDEAVGPYQPYDQLIDDALPTRQMVTPGTFPTTSGSPRTGCCLSCHGLASSTCTPPSACPRAWPSARRARSCGK